MDEIGINTVGEESKKDKISKSSAVELVSQGSCIDVGKAIAKESQRRHLLSTTFECEVLIDFNLFLQGHEYFPGGRGQVNDRRQQ